VGSGVDTTAAAYVEIQLGDSSVQWGVGIDPSIVTASLKALMSAINQAGDSAFA